MRFRTTILIHLVLLAMSVRVNAQPATTLFRGARVFDGERVVEATDVLVRDGRIAAVGRGLAAPAGAAVVDAAGRTLMPGLIDAHTHAFGDALREAVVFGVTTELDMFTDAGLARAMRAAQEAGRAHDRADLFSAGTLVTAPGGHGTQFGMTIPTITAAADAQAFVDARIAEGSDWIKIVYDDGRQFGLDFGTIDRATLGAVIEAAHRRGHLAVVHISTAAAARDAIEAGADGLVHAFTDARADRRFVELVRARGAFVIPTLVVLKSMTGTGGAAPLVEDVRLAPYIPAASRAVLTQSFPARPGADAFYDAVRETVAALHAAGVPILAGSDAPNPGTAHGSALHRELELLVDAGLTPVEALAAATRVPAAAFRLSDRGRIAEGLRADLLLVDGDPTRDITATRAIVGVWKGGERIDRAAFAAGIEAQRVAAEGPPPGLDDGRIADFEDASPAARFGTGWTATTDDMAGGASTVELSVVAGGAGGSAHALRIAGTISGAVPFAWAGAMWSAGQPMQPSNLSSKDGVAFAARGDGGTYRLLVFTQSGGMMPRTRTFAAPAAWTEVYVPWSALGTDGSDVMAIMFVGGPQPGDFAFEIDDIRLR